MSTIEILVSEYRNNILECVHSGILTVVSPEGLKYSVGDPNHLMFYRSASKPVQAIPVVQLGIDKKYGLTDEEVAIMAGSQRGEFAHIDVINSLMKKTEIREEMLVMLPTYPLDMPTKEELIKRKLPTRKIYHNCIGKHIACILVQRELGGREEDYWKPDSLSQQLIMDYVSLVSEYPRENIKTGTDGCGVPVFAVPIRYMANTFLRLACPQLVKNEEIKPAIERISSLMNKYPRMISGSNAICTLLNEDKNIVAKGGALGVYCFGLRKERLGIAYKVMDGSYDELPLIAVTILKHIGYEKTETIKRVTDQFPFTIKNDCGMEVGKYVIEFKLQGSAVAL